MGNAHKFYNETKGVHEIDVRDWSKLQMIAFAEQYHQAKLKEHGDIKEINSERELLISYELSQEIDGASPSQAMAEEMADKFLTTRT